MIFIKKFILGIVFLGGLFLFGNIIQAAESGDVIINEIAWMGTGSSTDEWIELYNTSSSDIDLAGWRLEGIGKKIIELDNTILEQGYFLLERTDDTTVPEISADIIYTGSLSNSGANLILKDQNNIVIDQVDCSSGWFKGDNSTKKTMEKTADGWQTSSNSRGTPKTPNSLGESDVPPEDNEEPLQDENDGEEEQGQAISRLNLSPIADAGNDIVVVVDQPIDFDASESRDEDDDCLNYIWNFGEGNYKEGKIVTHSYSLPGKYIVSLEVSDGAIGNIDTLIVEVYPKSIFISEFMPDPEGKDAPMDSTSSPQVDSGGSGEWIEIVNTSNRIIDLSGWQLDDEDGGSASFTIPKNTFIFPNAFLVFFRSITKISLNNTVDEVRLLYPSGEIADQIIYEDPEEGSSAALRGSEIFWTEIPTPGLQNIIYTKDTLAIDNSLQEKIVHNQSKEVESIIIINNKFVQKKNNKISRFLEEGKSKSVLVAGPESMDNIFEIKKVLASEVINENIAGDFENQDSSQYKTKADIIKIIQKATRKNFFNDPRLILFFTSLVSSMIMAFWVIDLKNRFKK